MAGPWYHGSQRELTVLRTGSSITEHVAIARAFSHRPRLTSISDDNSVQHDGTTPGYLYVVDEEISPDDIYPHPHPVNAGRWEWVARRELRVRLFARTEVRPEDMLTDQQIAELRRRQAHRGEQSFTC